MVSEIVRWKRYDSLRFAAEFQDALPPAIPGLIELLRDQDRNVRQAAASLLGDFVKHSR
jgi:HEAT repeat protein